jgi:hypothetical protein
VEISLGKKEEESGIEIEPKKRTEKSLHISPIYTHFNSKIAAEK